MCRSCPSVALGNGPWNSCLGHGEGQGAGGSASLASYLQWAPEGVHVDSWECRVVIAEGKLSKTLLVADGCEVTVPVLSIPDLCPKSLGQGSLVRNQLGWTTLLCTETLGGWVFQRALREAQPLAALASSVDWVVRGTYRTAWGVDPRCRCSFSYGGGGQQLGRKLEGAPGICSEVSARWHFSL